MDNLLPIQKAKQYDNWIQRKFWQRTPRTFRYQSGYTHFVVFLQAISINCLCISVESIVSKFSNGKVEDLTASKLCETSKLEVTEAEDKHPTESGDGKTTNEKPEV